MAHSIAPAAGIPQVTQRRLDIVHGIPESNEGHLLASAEIEGKWLALSRTILTQGSGRGFDALIIDVPEPVIEVLHMAFPGVGRVVTEIGRA